MHSDICGNNIRVKKINGSFVFNGIIDFSDLISGDSLYDLGRIFSHFQGNMEYLKKIINGYSEAEDFFEKNFEFINFYAIYFSVWMLSLAKSDNISLINKYKTIILTLLKYYKSYDILLSAEN